ncbi:hypothetical protein [Caballeronia glebae]|nr:hypothetical protein [Caballeronia glebae]
MRIDQFQSLPDLPRLIKHAPATEGDMQSGAELGRVPPPVVHYLLRHVLDKPWYGHLALAALVMAAQRYEHSTIYSAVSIVSAKEA